MSRNDGESGARAGPFRVSCITPGAARPLVRGVFAMSDSWTWLPLGGIESPRLRSDLSTSTSLVVVRGSERPFASLSAMSCSHPEPLRWSCCFVFHRL